MSYETFNPRNHQDDVLNAFVRFTRKFGYVYDGENRTVPATANTNELIAEWKEKDKARLFLSRAVSDEFLDDYEAAVTTAERTNITFETIVTKMKERYTPNTNKVRNHYIFHRLAQSKSDSFDDFVHKVRTNAGQCDFKCTSATCTVMDTLIRDQVITGTHNSHIRDEALKKQWGLDDLITNGRIIESGAIAASELKKDNAAHINRTKRGPDAPKKQKSKGKFVCFKCEETTCEGFQKCPYHNKQCPVCKKYGHMEKSRFCKGEKSAPAKKSKKKKNNKANRAEVVSSTSESDTDESSSDLDEEEHSVRAVFAKILAVKVEDDVTDNDGVETIQSPSHDDVIEPVQNRRYKAARRVSGRRRKPNNRRKKIDFHTTINVGGSDIDVLVDTGADVNVMSQKTAHAIGIKWKKCRVKLQPYGSKTVKVRGVYTGPIVFGETITLAEVYIVKQPLESLLSGDTAEELGIISFHPNKAYAVNTVEEEEERDDKQLPVSEIPYHEISSAIQGHWEV